MKTLTFTTILLVASMLTAGETVIRRGAAISANATAIPLEQVLEKPSAYEKDAVVVEGLIAKSCENKGCWMELTTGADKPGIRVTFKDYGFFVPLDSKGLKARVEGITVVKTLSKAHADHLEGEGAKKLKRNADGTATELSFIASGVELTKPAG